MTKLSDLINTRISKDTIQIQGVDIPVAFNYLTSSFIEEAYGKPYHTFEKDFKKSAKEGELSIAENELKLMNSLIYALIRSGGTDTTIAEVENSIPFSDLPAILQTTLDVFRRQNFK